MPSPFTIEKSVDKNTGKTIVSIKANGQDCETFILEAPIAKRYVGFSLILQDLEDALWWIRKAHSLLPSKSKAENQSKITNSHIDSSGEDKFKAIKAYFYSCIVTYGKCFCSTEGRGIKLEAKNHVDKRHLPCHERVMDFRNNLVAHAGGAFDSGEVVVGPNPSGPEFHVLPNLWRLDFEDDRELEISLEDLILHVKENVRNTQNDILNRLLTVEARQAVIDRRGF